MIQKKVPASRGTLFSLALLFGLATAGASWAGQAGADAELKRLADRAANNAGDAEQLRQEIHAFRQAHPGTPQALGAAKLLHDLPSLFDKYDPKTIHPLEKFSWHPPELVALLGEHRGRQGGPVTSVAFSRNGKLLVSGSSNGFVRFWAPGHHAAAACYGARGRHLRAGHQQGQ